MTGVLSTTSPTMTRRLPVKLEPLQLSPRRRRHLPAPRRSRITPRTSPRCRGGGEGHLPGNRQLRGAWLYKAPMPDAAGRQGPSFFDDKARQVLARSCPLPAYGLRRRRLPRLRPRRCIHRRRRRSRSTMTRSFIPVVCGGLVVVWRVRERRLPEDRYGPRIAGWCTARPQAEVRQTGSAVPASSSASIMGALCRDASLHYQRLRSEWRRAEKAGQAPHLPRRCLPAFLFCFSGGWCVVSYWSKRT